MAELVPIPISDFDIRGIYRILSNMVVPRPIAFVSTIGTNGVHNLAPFSFFMAGGSNPPSMCFSPTPSRTGDKDSLRNVRDTGEFVINLVDRAMLEGMNATAATLPPDESEWPVSHFEQGPPIVVKPPLVAQAPAAFECKLFQIVEHGDGIASARYVIGEVVHAHVRSDFWDGENLHPEAAAMIGRLGATGYLDISESRVFQLVRPD